MVAAFSDTSFSTDAFSTSAFSFGTAPVVVTTPDGAGNIDWLKAKAPRRKKKSNSTVIRFSDFDSQEAYAAALAAAAMPISQVSDSPTLTPEQNDDEFEDDDAILFAIMRIYH